MKNAPGDARNAQHDSSSSNFKETESAAVRQSAPGPVAGWETCSPLGVRNTNITTADEYANFDFQVNRFFTQYAVIVHCSCTSQKAGFSCNYIVYDRYC